MTDDGPGFVMQIDGDESDPVSLEQRHAVLHQGDAPYGHHGYGTICGEGPESGSLAGGQDQCFHQDFLWRRVSAGQCVVLLMF